MRQCSTLSCAYNLYADDDHLDPTQICPTQAQHVRPGYCKPSLSPIAGFRVGFPQMSHTDAMYVQAASKHLRLDLHVPLSGRALECNNSVTSARFYMSRAVHTGLGAQLAVVARRNLQVVPNCSGVVAAMEVEAKRSDRHGLQRPASGEHRVVIIQSAFDVKSIDVKNEGVAVPVSVSGN